MYLGHEVAIRVLKQGFEGDEVGARFWREGRTAARFSHPNIVRVYDELDGGEISCIVIEYAPGDLGASTTWITPRCRRPSPRGTRRG